MLLVVEDGDEKTPPLECKANIIEFSSSSIHFSKKLENLTEPKCIRDTYLY